MIDNIIILTPFYPIEHRKDLYEDTKAIYYLLKEFDKENLLIIHSFNHNYISALKNIKKININRKNVEDFLYVDDYGNDLLFFENFFVVPSLPKGLNKMDEKYAALVNEYYIRSKKTPDVLVTHFPTYYFNFLEKLKIVDKKIAIIHSFDLINIKKWKKLSFWNAYFNSFDAIGYRSYVIKEEFESIIDYKGKTFMNLSGIPDKYLKHSLTEKKTTNENTVNLLFAGRLDKNKNVISVLKALDNMKIQFDFHLTIVGEGEEKKTLEKFVAKKQLENNVTFKGRLSRNETFKEMINNDVFIMVSKKETLGLVYLEAMAAGCLVIGSKGQGIDGIIKNGVNGFLARSEDIEDITNTIVLINNLSIKQRNNIIKNAKNTASKFSDTKASEIYKKNIHSVIDRK